MPTNRSECFAQRQLTGSQHYNHAANERTAARHADYNAWIRSHTPEQIRIANNARAQLRRILAKPGRSAAHTAKLVDDRHVKSLPTPYVLFFTERHASGDMKGISVPDAAKVASKEWKALSPDEKKVCSSDSFDRTHAHLLSEI
jgi:hypothetical protein